VLDNSRIIENIYHSGLSIDALDSGLNGIYKEGYPFVSIQQFLDDDYYFGKIAKDLYPENRPDLEDIFDPEKSYIEIILGGAIGYGKTFVTTIGLCYMIGQLSVYIDPHRWLGASPTSPLVFINMSVSGKKAKEVIFTRVKTMLDSSPYFQEKFCRNKRLIDTMEWNVDPNDKVKRSGQQIIFKPGTGESLSALGDDIYGGACDELNFFRIVEKSKRAFGDRFDPAQKLYDTISRRMKSRFLSGGIQLGKLFLVSSAQVPEDFIERRILEAEKDGSLGNTVKYIKKSQWEGKRGVTVAGRPVFSEQTFRVEVGDANRKSRLLDRVDLKTKEVISVIDSEARINGKVIEPPIDFWDDFYRDLDGSIRDFGGEVTRAINPFFTDIEVIYTAAESGTDQGLIHPWAAEETTLEDGMRLLINKVFKYNEKKKRWKPIRHPNKARYWHIDISLSGDALGLSIVHTCGWRQVCPQPGVYEDRPIIETDLMLRVVPPYGGEIKLGNVRSILYQLQNHGMYLAVGSLDLKMMSSDFMQIVRTKGLTCGHLSVDTDFTPYRVLKDVFYDGRMVMYSYEPVITELVRLEKRLEKVDHPADGSKDVSDSLAGAVYNLFTNELRVSPRELDARLPLNSTVKEKDTLDRRMKDEAEKFRTLVRAGKVIK